MEKRTYHKVILTIREQRTPTMKLTTRLPMERKRNLIG
jgi:hypothetical protein